MSAKKEALQALSIPQNVVWNPFTFRAKEIDESVDRGGDTLVNQRIRLRQFDVAFCCRPKRWACLKLTPSTPAADTVVRRPASTSVKTSTRCKSCLLICTQPNLSPPTLISEWGSDTLALQSYDIIALLLQGLKKAGNGKQPQQRRSPSL